ncbi:flagellin FliC [bacterium]|nr:flagellin FliC [bacterium]
MGFTIQTNSLANTAMRNLGNTEERVGSTIQRLATGSRIVRAADDPAGLAISDQLNATIRSIGQAQRNAQDAISAMQVFEGGTTEISNMLIRMRELSIQSASDTVGERERKMLNLEVQELKSEVDRLAKSTTYMGRQLLAGDDIRLEFQVGVGNDEEKDRIVFDPGRANVTSSGLGIDGIDVTNRDDAREGLESLDTALTTVNELRAKIGSSQNRLQITINSQGIQAENLTAAKSRIRDADVAAETTALTKDMILRQAGVSVLAAANESPKLALQLLSRV